MPFFIDKDMWRSFNLNGIEEDKKVDLSRLRLTPFKGIEVKEVDPLDVISKSGEIIFMKQERFTPEMKQDIQKLKEDLSSAKREIFARYGIKLGKAKARGPGPLEFI